MSEHTRPQTPARPAPGVSYIVGLDLGQAQDYSALCVVERAPQPDPADAARTIHAYGVRHLQRWTLGTPYPQVVADVAELTARPPLPGSRLAVDGTGVGKAVVDLFRKANLRCGLTPIVITAGRVATCQAVGWSVPKKDLIAVMQALVQSRRFHVAPGLKEAKTLGEELKHFRVKVTAAGNETFEAWRERDKDDLVLSVALACWLGERGLAWEPPIIVPRVVTDPLASLRPRHDSAQRRRGFFGHRPPA